MPRTTGARVAVLGEAKATNRPRGGADLSRLAHIKELLGQRAADASLVIFSRTGFTDGLRTAQADGEVPLVSLADLYQRTG